MPIKEILLVALVIGVGCGFAWAFHNVGCTGTEQTLQLLRSLDAECDDDTVIVEVDGKLTYHSLTYR